jgi:hypothetical protein
MRKDEDGKPRIASDGKGLGVRGAPVNGVTDVDLDEEGRVVLNVKGMSVCLDWPPYFLISKRLKDRFPEARGPVDLYRFTMGEGPFDDGPVADGLDLKKDKVDHGLVVPRELVPLDRFQTDLANTRDRWTEDE